MPTGNNDDQQEHNVFGIQFSFPLSKRLSDDFVTHFNIGLTYLPNVKTTSIYGDNYSNDIINYNVGGSLIWLVESDFNIFLEYLKNYYEYVSSNGDILNISEDIVNPGIRYAINIGKLQIVPGISMPISITTDLTKAGVFFYLSFEHPF